MTTLRFAPELTLPVDAATQRFAFLGRIGSGKSYAATKLAELMIEAGIQVVAIDPAGVWYGLRVDGTGKGFPIPVLGGLHGDVPLAADKGAMIADLIVDRRLSCVLDISQFEHDTDKARFVSAFIARFFFRKKSAPSAVHLFFEECQEVFPQDVPKGEQQMLHDANRMAKLGRNFGIGLSLISQRPQEVNKKALNLTECMFAFQVRGKHERVAMKDWVSNAGADETILAELPHLPVGVAHVDSPQWLKVSEKVKCYPKRTADVSSTPKVDAVPVEAKPLTPVDLGNLREAMAETIEKAKADDPKELQRRIRELEREVRAAENEGRTTPSDITQAYQRGLADGERRATRKIAEHDIIGMRSVRDKLLGHKARIESIAEQVASDAGALTAAIAAAQKTVEDSRADVQVGHHEQGTGANHPSTSTVRQQSRSTTRAAVTPRGDLKSGQQKILNALAELEVLGVKAATRHQLGMVAGYNLTGGTGAQHIADLNAAGLVEIPDKGSVRLTDAGRASADSGGVPRTLDELHERVLAKLSGGQRRIAEHLISIYPDAISRAELGAAVNYNLTGGTGAQHVADLVTVGAAKIPGAGKVVASDLLFPEWLR